MSSLWLWRSNSSETEQPSTFALLPPQFQMSEPASESSSRQGHEIYIESLQQLKELSLQMVQGTTRHLDIVSRSLDPAVYDTPEFVQAVRALAVTKRSRIRILVLQPESLLSRGGHRLVELAMRLSSHLEIRKPGIDDEDFNEALMIVDGRAGIRRALADRYEGVANFKSQAWVARLSESFERLWQNAEPDPHFRRLML